MAIKLSQLVAQVNDQHGQPMKGARVTMQLSDYDIPTDTNTIVTPNLHQQTLAESKTDTQGLALIEVFPNSDGTQSTNYLVNVYDANTGRKIIDNRELTVPEGNYMLSGLMAGSTNQIPTIVSMVAPLTGTQPLTVVGSATGTADPNGTIASYKWYLDGVEIGTGESLSHEITDFGDKVLKLEVADDLGGINLKEYTISVAQNTATPSNRVLTAVISVIPTSGDAPLTVALNGTGSTDTGGSITQYEWFVDNVSIGTGQTLNHTFTTAGIKNVRLTVTNDENTTDDAIQLVTVTTATVNPPTSAFTLDATSGNTPLAVTATSTATPGDNPIATTEYDFGDGGGFGTAATYTYTSAGTFTVTQRVADASNNSNTSTQTVTVTVPSTLPTAGFNLDVTTGTAPLTVNATSTATAGSFPIATTEYDYGDGGGFVTATSYTYNNAGSYTVTQRVTDTNSGTNTTTVAVTVGVDNLALAQQAVTNLELTGVPVAAFTATPENGSGPLTVTLDATPTSIQDYDTVLAQVNALPASTGKTELLDRLNVLLLSLSYQFNL